jgi:hypothetical protein
MTSALRYTVEPLETRQLLAAINWTNRNTFSGASDNRFDEAFGTMANQAIGVVDAAIATWQRSIASFNYGTGTDVYSLTVRMNDVGGDGTLTTAGAANGGSNSSVNGKPKSGSMGLGWNTGVAPTATTAAGWFLDPTPGESSEFQGGWANAFVRFETTALGGGDLFSVVMHELGHCMGLGAGPQTWQPSVSQDTGDLDTVSMPATTPPSTLWAYNDNASLWTEWDSGGAVPGGASNKNGPQHFAWRDNSATFGSETRVGAVALMNPGTPTRSTVSDVEMDCLRLAYGYSIIKPSRFGTTYGQLDADGTLRIDTSSLGNSNDVIVINASAFELTVKTTLGSPVATIDPVGEFTSVFPTTGVQRIRITTGDGSDVIRIDGNGGAPCTVNGGTGNDNIEFAPTSYDLSNITGITYVNGGDDYDQVYAFDNNQTAALTYTITSAQFSRPGWGGFYYDAAIEPLNLITGLAGDIVNVANTYTNQAVYVWSAGGTDTVNIGNSAQGISGVNGSVFINNDPSTTVLNINNGPDTSPHTWQVDTAGDYGYLFGMSQGSIHWDNRDISSINLTCGSGLDTGTFKRLSETFNLNNTGGNDIITVGSSAAFGVGGITGQLTIDNNPALTTLTIDDTGNNVARTITIDETGGYNTVSGLAATGSVRFDSFDVNSATLIAGGGVDTLNLLRNDETLTINTSGGADIVNIGNATYGVQAITGSVTVRNTPDYTTLNINDTGNNLARTAIVEGGSDPAFEELRQLAQATIAWRLSGIQTVNITTGGAADSLTIYRNSKPMILDSAGGQDNVQIGHAGVGGLQFITGAISVKNSPSHTNLIVSDAGGTVARNASMDVFGSPAFGRVSNLAPVPIVWNNSDINTLTIGTGNMNDTVALYGSSEDLRFNSSGGNDGLFFGGVNGLAGISGAVTVDNTSGGTTEVVVDDFGATTNKTAVTVAHPTGDYTVISNFAPATLRFNDTRISRVTLRSGNVTGIAPDKFDVTGTAIQLGFVNNGGPDVVQLGGGTLGADAVQAPVSISGAAANTSASFLDYGVNISRNMTLDDDGVNATLTGFGPYNHTMSISAINATNFVTGIAGDSLNIRRAQRTVRVGNNAAGSPNDYVTLGNSANGMADINANIEQSISLSPVGFVMNDTVALAGRGYDFQPQYFGNLLVGNRITFDGDNYLEHFMDSRTVDVFINAGSGDDNFNVPFARHPGFYLNGAGGDDTYTLASHPTEPSNPIYIYGDGGLDSLYVNDEEGSTGAVGIFSTMHFRTVSVGFGGDLSFNANNSALYTQAFSLGFDSVFDLGSNSFILDYNEESPLETVRDEISQGRNGGNWLGNGITSSGAIVNPDTTIGYGEASDLFSSFPATFMGQSVDSTTILVRYTPGGNANLDRQVNTLDFNLLAGNFGGDGKVFSQGDFDYSGEVDSVDFGILVSQYGKTLPATSALTAPSLSPTTLFFGGAPVVESEDDAILMVA